MQLYRKSLLLLCAMLLACVAPGFASAADDGTNILAESCSGCHSARVRPLDNVHLTREQWKDTIDRMIDQGAEVPKGKIPVLLDYLAKTHGPIVTATDADKK